VNGGRVIGTDKLLVLVVVADETSVAYCVD